MNIFSIFAAAAVISILPLTASEFDFTGGTVPENTSHIELKHLKNNRLDCYAPFFCLNPGKEVLNREQFTISVWFSPNKQFSRRPFPETLLFGKTPFSKENNIGFLLGICGKDLEFKWWNHKERVYRGIIAAGGKRNRFYLPSAKDVALKPNRWQMATAVSDGRTLKLYLNQEQVAEMPLPVPVRILDSELNLGFALFGGGRKGYLFHGCFGRISFFPRALSGAEVRSLHEKWKPHFSAAVADIHPPGYDFDFRHKLARTAAFEKNMPENRVAPGVKASVDASKGYARLLIDGKEVYPMMFTPKAWETGHRVMGAVRDFAAAGVFLQSATITTNDHWNALGRWWKGFGEYDFSEIDKFFREIIQNSPQARILIRIKIDMPHWWWLKRYPEHSPVYWSRTKNAYVPASNSCGLTSPEWTESYSRMLNDFIVHVEKSDYADHVIGYLPAGGYASEWYYHGCTSGLIDYSPVARRDFIAYLKKRYGSLEKLNAAWRKTFKRFEEAEVPAPELRLRAENGIFRDVVQARPVTDYLDFLNKVTGDAICNAVSIVKKATGGRKLAGVFYGYGLLSRYSGMNGLLNTGHGALNRILNCGELDFICTPTEYGARKGGEPGVQIGEFNGSLLLHGKMFWDEADYRTHLVPVYQIYPTDSPEETREVLRRTFGYMLAKGHGVWWFALGGNHIFHTEEIMDEMADFQKLGRKYLEVPKKSVAEIALIFDEPSIRYVSFSETSTAFLQKLIFETVRNLHCSGTAADLYLSDDLGNPKMKDYKLYVFLNLFYVTPERREMIRRKLRKNNAAAVWLYAPGYLSDDGTGVESMKRLTGLTFRQTGKLPAFSPVGAAPMEFRQTDGFRSAYSGRPVTPGQFRTLAKQLGIHVYSETDDVFYPGGNFLILHTVSGGKKVIRLPGSAKVTEILSGKVHDVKNNSFSENLPQETTRVYFLEQ